MCLAVPGKVIGLEEDKAIIDYEGEQREANASLMEITLGDYVVVSSGFIIEKLTEEEAKRSLETWKK